MTRLSCFVCCLLVGVYATRFDGMVGINVEPNASLDVKADGEDMTILQVQNSAGHHVLSAGVAGQTPMVALGDLSGNYNNTILLVNDEAEHVLLSKHLIVETVDGVVVMSPNGHYWRIAVNNLGVISTTDLGTNRP